MSIRNYANQKNRQIYNGFIQNLSTLPISFIYDDIKYHGFQSDEFTLLDIKTVINGVKESNVLTLARDNMHVIIDTAYYENYGAYEWTIWFENCGHENTGIIRELHAADMAFAGEEPILKGILGDYENKYRPYSHRLADDSVNFKSVNGRPTHIWFPYFNLEHGDGGTLIALGWGGTWEASFTYNQNDSTHFTGIGTNGLCTYLKPGERIRTPLMAFIPYWVRDEDYASNLWRSWYVDCNMPKQNGNGDSLKPFLTSCLSGDTGLPNSDGSISERHFTWKPSLDAILKHDIKIDYRWFDAGWYFDPYGQTVESDWWGTVGTWELDTVKWPKDSFKESVDYARQHGIKTLAWFEPERVTHVDGLVENYGYNPEWAIYDGYHATANNIGDSECLKWTTDRIISMMDKSGIDLYREDNNSNPAPCWKVLDAAQGENRIGITENKAVVGHYQLWDNIINYCAQNGKDTFVDSCASGGVILNTYKCKKIHETIVIDGNVNKPVWNDIEGMSLSEVVTGKSPKQETLCRLAWDDNYLYVAFECKDDYINASLTEYNSEIYNEEVVEIFLDDDCDLKTYIEIEVSPLNTLLHYSMQNDLKGNKLGFARVEKKIITQVMDNREEKVWSVEMAIPFSEFVTAPNIPPKAGDKWLMNLYRIDRPEDGSDEYTAWQPTGKVDYHMPEKFGELVFVE